MNKYLVEFVGTFFLVLTIGCVVIAPGAGAMAPVAIGAALIAMVYAGGAVSGAHYNPAVTLAVFMRGRCPGRDVLPYMLAQIGGASLAAAVVLFLKGTPLDAAGMLPDVPRAFVAEFLFTFALVYVVLNVATAKGTAGNPFYGLAIGFIVITGGFAVGGISGAVFNPAVALGITIMGLTALGNIWVFLAANFTAAATAALVFKALNRDDS